MPTSLENVFDIRLFEQMLAGKYVKVATHPELPLRILNYTSRAQFDGVWNDVTRSCRGLIIDARDNVVARPFTKFFNLEQHTTGLPAGPVQVTEKMDGSLGILYPTGNGFAVATRGSFTSDQAQHATTIWRDRYEPVASLNPSWTYLCEIIYPANRIVVDYRELDDLVLLGAVDTSTGRSVALSAARDGWPAAVVAEHPYSSLSEAVAVPARPNAEGFVIHFTDADLRMKVKHDEYVRLHRLFTDVSERRVWEALSEGVDLDEWLTDVPDELYDFVRATRRQLLDHFEAIDGEMRQHLSDILDQLSESHARSEFAAAVVNLSRVYPLANGLFSLYDGKDHSKLIWSQIRPPEHVPLFNRNSDVE